MALVLAPLIAPTLTLTLGQEDIGVSSPSTTQRRAFDLIGFGKAHPYARLHDAGRRLDESWISCCVHWMAGQSSSIADR